MSWETIDVGAYLDAVRQRAPVRPGEPVPPPPAPVVVRRPESGAERAEFTRLQQEAAARLAASEAADAARAAALARLQAKAATNPDIKDLLTVLDAG